MWNIDYFAITDRGNDPDGNDDCVLLEPEVGCFVVADGMGGRRGGGRASRTAAEAFVAHVERLRAENEVDREHLQAAVDYANKEVRAIAATEPEMRGLGTTLSAVLLAGPVAIVVHVGDSRIYLYRTGDMTRLTADHTLVEELVRRNYLSQSAAGVHPLRNVLSRCVGTQEEVKADITQMRLADGDLFVLATDGLVNALGEEHLQRALRTGKSCSCQDFCRTIMESAIRHRPRDNATVAVIRLTADGAKGTRSRKGSCP